MKNENSTQHFLVTHTPTTLKTKKRKKMSACRLKVLTCERNCACNYVQAEVLAYKQEKLTASWVLGPVFWLAVGLAVAPAFILMSSLHILLESQQVTEKLSLFQTFHWPVTNTVHKKMCCVWLWCLGWFHVTSGQMCVSATFFGSLCELERDTKRDVAVISAQQWWRWFRERASVTFSLHSSLFFFKTSV